MGWPLIIGLAAQGAQAESAEHDKNVAGKYADEASRAKVEADERKRLAAHEEARRQALMRALQSGAQPMGTTPGEYIDLPEQPNMWGPSAQAVGQGAASISGYLANRPKPIAPAEPMSPSA